MEVLVCRARHFRNQRFKFVAYLCYLSTDEVLLIAEDHMSGLGGKHETIAPYLDAHCIRGIGLRLLDLPFLGVLEICYPRVIAIAHGRSLRLPDTNPTQEGQASSQERSLGIHERGGRCFLEDNGSFRPIDPVSPGQQKEKKNTTPGGK